MPISLVDYPNPPISDADAAFLVKALDVFNDSNEFSSEDVERVKEIFNTVFYDTAPQFVLEGRVWDCNTFVMQPKEEKSIYLSIHHEYGIKPRWIARKYMVWGHTRLPVIEARSFGEFMWMANLGIGN